MAIELGGGDAGVVRRLQKLEKRMERRIRRRVDSYRFVPGERRGHPSPLGVAARAITMPEQEQRWLRASGLLALTALVGIMFVWTAMTMKTSRPTFIEHTGDSIVAIFASDRLATVAPRVAGLSGYAPYELSPSSSAEMIEEQAFLPELGGLYAEVEGPGDAIDPFGGRVRMLTVSSGDTLAGLLGQAGVQRADQVAVLDALAPVFQPRNIRAGYRIRIEFAEGDASRAISVANGSAAPDTQSEPPRTLARISFKPEVDKEIIVERDAAGQFVASEKLMPLTARTFRASGIIDSSLFMSAMAAGVPDAITVELIRMFSYDVDFQREIQPGDSFEVYFTRFYNEFGEPVKSGTIMYGALTLSGQKIALYLFTPSDDGIADYFDPDGRSSRKFLMRTPIDGARISSGFGMRRHPVLGYSKMHRGTDFAAPTGTPIMAAGSGTIEFAARNGSYGNYVRIRHNDEYKTAYAHMSRFGPGISKGVRVQQGQIIGYVGTTGRSTGPHLHYEVLLNGEQVNPMGVKMPTGRNLQGDLLTAFLAERARIDADMAETPISAPVESAGEPSLRGSRSE